MATRRTKNFSNKNINFKNKNINTNKGHKKLLGGSKLLIQQHRHSGIFVARGKEDAICTKNLNFGESVYGEKRIIIGDYEKKNRI